MLWGLPFLLTGPGYFSSAFKMLGEQITTWVLCLTPPNTLFSPKTTCNSLIFLHSYTKIFFPTKSTTLIFSFNFIQRLFLIIATLQMPLLFPLNLDRFCSFIYFFFALPHPLPDIGCIVTLIVGKTKITSFSLITPLSLVLMVFPQQPVISDE